MGTLLPESFPTDHIQTPVDSTALIRNAVKRPHQLLNLHHRVEGRHPLTGVPKNVGNRRP